MAKPNISVHILAKETTELGRRMFLACVQNLLDANYANEIIVIDNGCSKKIVDDVGDLLSTGKPSLERWGMVQDDSSDFSVLRNTALDCTYEDSTHFHWIDTDEVYPVETLQKLKDFVESDPDIAAFSSWFWHFMIDPSKWQYCENKTNIYKIVPGLRWELPVHEHLVGYDKSKVRHTNLDYFHFGYIRPQWVQALKWFRYAIYDHGNANVYREYYDDGWKKVVDYYTDERNPNQCLEDRIPHCNDFDVDRYKYPESFVKLILDPWRESGIMGWDEWLSTVNDYSFWDSWKAKREELGDWKETIGWACKESGLGETNGG